MGRATEELAERSGNVIGGLLNVTFGNAPELIIALFALGKGLHEVVKASLVGSILGNILLVMGAAMLVGGLSGGRTRGVQKFGRTAASVQSTMLLLAVAAMIMPGVFALVRGRGSRRPGAEQVHYGSDRRAPLARGRLRPDHLLRGRPALLAATHAATLQPARGRIAHRGPGRAGARGARCSPWRSPGRWSGVLSEILVGSIEETSHAIGLSEFFIGAIVVAIVGNAAEHWVAVLVAYKNKMSLAVNIAIGSSAQVALFVTPVLVLSSFFLGPCPMPLVFNGFELAALAIAAIIANQVTQEGESTWYEGLQLLRSTWSWPDLRLRVGSARRRPDARVDRRPACWPHERRGQDRGAQLIATRSSGLPRPGLARSAARTPSDGHPDRPIAAASCGSEPRSIGSERSSGLPAHDGLARR